MRGRPFVTAMCLTRNRRPWLPQAIRCFQNQTYPNKELLILADGADVRDIVPEDERIRLIQIEEGRLIGEKRNFAAEHAHGEILAHWDDDDCSGPRRLEDQVARLQQDGKAVTSYYSMYFTDGRQWWLFKDRSAAIGTSLCYKKSWWRKNPFNAVQVGEDGEFAGYAARKNQLSKAPAGDLLVASIHSGNTSPRHLRDSEPWTRVSPPEIPWLEFPCA